MISIDQLEKENAALRAALAAECAKVAKVTEALAWFLTDERFHVAVGGNPHVVERMLESARHRLETAAALLGEKEGE